jgi:hypothetical protein
MNLDETGLCLFQGGGRGNVFVRRRQGVAQRVPRQKRRSYITHVAVVCDQIEVQPVLPQFIVGNERTFRVQDMAALHRVCPPNVVLVRQRSAWNNKLLCARIVRHIGTALAKLDSNFQPVLLLDASRIHCASDVINACSQAGIWVVLVPSLLTWLLQPLDTHTFQVYKARLRFEYRRVRCDQFGRDLTIVEFVECVCVAIRVVLQDTRWDFAFDKDGFGAGQALVSTRIRAKFEATASIVAPSSRPSEFEIGLCFPRNARVPLTLLWRPFDGPRAVSVLRRATAMNTVHEDDGASLFPVGSPLASCSFVMRSAAAPLASARSVRASTLRQRVVERSRSPRILGGSTLVAHCSQD